MTLQDYSKSMLTLTLDTSTHRGTVALSEDATVIEEIFWDKSTSHSEQIVGEIHALYSRAHKKITETQKLICGVGPGSFTGIRVALSFAKALAHSLKIPVIPIENCWAIALQTDPTSESVIVALDAQKNMLFVGEYQWTNQVLKTVKSVRLLTEAEFLKMRNPQSVYISNVPGIFKNNNLKLSDHTPFPSARLIFKHVHLNADHYPSLTWDELAPLYLRASAAEEVLAQKKK